jgi:hypothetical protein
MTDETTTPETSAVEATPATVRTRAAALVATVDGVAHKLLKYAFPTKAIAFGVQVNGVEAQACVTAGRGSSYTYLLINNTGFYLPKNVVLESGAEISIDFPEGYAFDESQAVRVSTYKPKAKRAPAVEGEGQAAETAGEYPAQEAAEEAATEGRADDTPRAKRRGRK